ncbi:membrane-spanning 4-domains subfamily A member 12 isoform X2 [Bos taurus]|uniref:membrane-spanning 4-domains subfamily A member 12 isoform X2 n=1 Tax=Bos taurus TaxID=9913 RepID=UPI0028CB2B0F|nr:membrane-spanning 4-domains subfamily A member 12 isoform X2 [Bos taurus]
MEAVQVMIGLINGALGRIWLLFYTRQFEELSVEYKPIALLSGYPFWTFLFFIISGVLTIQTEKKRSPNSLKCAIRMNMSSFFLAVLGLILIGFEITLFLFKRETIFWQEKTAMILSVYLWIFSIMELIIARKVIKWGNEAFYRHRYVTPEIPEQKEANLSESHTLRRHHRIPKEGGESEWTSLRSKPWQDQKGGTQLVKIPVTLGASRGHQSFPVSRPEVPWITIQGGNS